MNLKKIRSLLLCTLVLSAVMAPLTYAESAFEIVGSNTYTLKTHESNSSLRQEAPDAGKEGKKVIQLLKVKLSDEEKAHLANQAHNMAKHENQFVPNTNKLLHSELPKSVKLGMNNVPVLDQGRHGTCVTFAITAAFDALLGQGDYISQVCNLQLGSYLELHGYSNSGWNGSYPIEVLTQIQQYGVISKKNQKSYGCGGLFDYPTYSSHSKKSYMTPESFASLSEPIIGNLATWSNIRNKDDAESTLNNVKEALNEGDRVAFAVLLPSIELGTAGAVAFYKTWFYEDTWVLSDAVLAGVDSIDAAHEMVITGYDNEAQVVDNRGKKHKGLLTLRNSWSSSVGYWGEFYMSYDYFKLLAIDVKRVSHTKI
ncbi:MAG: C1 family peptidase [Legionella sp.]|uniref:peptidase C1 n=1 Tax=Legionella sp. TaxID=459 RepID=UPI0039E304AD